MTGQHWIPCKVSQSLSSPCPKCTEVLSMTQGCCQEIGEGWHQWFKNYLSSPFQCLFQWYDVEARYCECLLDFSVLWKCFFHIIVKSGDPAGGTINGAFSLAILVLLLRYQYANLNNREGDSKRKWYLFRNRHCNGNTCAIEDYVYTQEGKQRQRFLKKKWEGLHNVFR